MAHPSQIMQQLTAAMNDQQYHQKRVADLGTLLVTTNEQLTEAKKAEEVSQQRAMQLTQALSVSLAKSSAVSATTQAVPEVVTFSPSPPARESLLADNTPDGDNIVTPGIRNELNKDLRDENTLGENRSTRRRKRKPGIATANQLSLRTRQSSTSASDVWLI